MAKQKNKKNNKRNIDFKQNMKIYWSFLKKYKWKFFFMLFLSLIVAATSVADKYLFKIIVDKGGEFTAGTLPQSQFVDILIIIGIVFGVIIITKMISKFINFHLLINISAKMITNLKRKYFNHLITLDHRFHTSHKTGSLISRTIRGGNAIDRMNDIIAFDTAPLIFQLFLVVGSLIYLNLMPAVVVIIMTVVFVTYSVILQKVSRPYIDEVNRTEDYEKASISDIFTNIETVKYFGKENSIKNKFKKTSNNTKKAFAKAWGLFKWLDAGQAIVLGVGLFFLIYLPILSFIDGNLTVGSLVFIYTVYGTLIGPLFRFVHGLRGYNRAMVDFQALFEYGKIDKEIKDSPNATALKIKKGKIEFKDIDFRYHKKKIFENFNLKIPQNKTVALVGHSGCGKSTLIKLLYRLYDVEKGEILVDGKDIRNIKQESLRSEMSIVPQEPILFDDTVYNNIKFSNPKATREQVMEAMKFAQLDKVVNNFPEKEKTIVGERGVKLSGGEKQRVSIARAILANKKVLVLDEATSSLDSETESEIQKDLERLMQGRTSIVIAHRLSTIMHADKIIVLKDGKIVQQGKHKDLIKQSGEYKKLWNLQKGGYIK